VALSTASRSTILTVVCALCVWYRYAAGWLAWSIGLCWHVRAAPPYPVLKAAYDEGVATWLPLYAGIIGSGLVCTVATHYL
jgi:hypothetical protein